MSVSLVAYIEAQDAQDKWHLVKWFSKDGNFEKRFHVEPDGTPISIDGEESKYRSDNCLILSNMWRDIITKSWWEDRIDPTSSIPDDISDDLEGEIKSRYEKFLSNFRLSEEYTYETYKKQFGCIYLNDMFSICSDKYDRMKEKFISEINNIKNDKICRRLDEIEVHLGIKQAKKKTKKSDEDEYYSNDKIEEILEPLFDEDDDITYLLQGAYELHQLARAFTGNEYIPSEQVRLIYYCY